MLFYKLKMGGTRIVQVLLLLCVSVSELRAALTPSTVTVPANYLSLINAYRRQVGASNMLLMSWHNTLASMGQTYATNCRIFTGYPTVSDWQGSVPWNNPRIAMFILDSPTNYQKAFSTWFNERTNYNYGTRQCSSTTCFDYLSMVNAASYNVGCGVHYCPAVVDSTGTNTIASNSYLMVCYFGPPMQPNTQHYTLGTACGSCPTTRPRCEIGLCTTTDPTVPTPPTGPLGTWQPWGQWICSVTCGQGLNYRVRTCTTTNCPGASTEHSTCTLGTCPAPLGTWTAWVPSGACSVTCGTGIQAQSRICTTGNCIGTETTKMGICTLGNCPGVPTGTNPTQWGPWSMCSAECAGGTRSRFKVCYGGVCTPTAPSYETGTCNQQTCPQDGTWNVWGPFGTCSVTCGQGIRIRTRTCNKGRDRCPGSSAEMENCNTGRPCPVTNPNPTPNPTPNPGPTPSTTWTTWSAYSNCDKTCGPGSRIRSRQFCTSTTNCLTQSMFQNCNLQACTGTSPTPTPTANQWGIWQAWTVCSKTCGSGDRFRYRLCTGQCTGQSYQLETCTNQASCLTPTVWNNWGAWGACSATCGTGTRTRTRTCNGAGCQGQTTDTSPCTAAACSIIWSAWTPWTTCSATCGRGSSVRTSSCLPRPCIPVAKTETRTCQIIPCSTGGTSSWSSWVNWGQCTVTCGGGTRSRDRLCQGIGCQGPVTETSPCSTSPCPQPQTGWTAWSVWSACSTSCGSGLRARARVCRNGGQCPGRATDVANCNQQACVIYAKGWDFWTDWTPCSAQCGVGVVNRIRTCNQPPCEGPGVQNQTCFTKECSPGSVKCFFGIWCWEVSSLLDAK